MNFTPSSSLQKQPCPGEAQLCAVADASPFGGSGWVASVCLCVWESGAGTGSLCRFALLPLDVRKRLSAGKEEGTAEGMCSISGCQSLGHAFLTPSPKSSPALSPGPAQRVGLGCPGLSISTETKLGTSAVRHLRPPPRVCPERSFLHSGQQGLVCPLGTGAGDWGSWGVSSSPSSSGHPAGHGLSSKVGDESTSCPNTQLGHNGVPPPLAKADRASQSPTGMMGCFTEQLGSEWGQL